jgi:hypothetical protein
VSATIVLLKLVLMWAWPIAMFLRTRRRVRPRVAACLLVPGTLLRLLSASDGLLRALAAAGIRLRPLPVHREAAAVPDPPIGTDLGEPLDRLLPVAAQVALDLEVRVDVVAELRDLLVGEVLDLRVRVEAELGGDLAGSRLADAVDVGQPDLEALLVREIDSGDACDGSALPLLVSRVGADDHGRAVPLDHAAALTHGLDGGANFHD